MMRVVQVSDLHLCAADGTGRSAAEAVANAILDLVPAPDAVIVTGDLAQDGTAADYQLLRHILGALPMPLLLVPGNHDRRAFFRTGLASLQAMPGKGTLNVSLTLPGLRIIGLDSLTEGQDYGTLSEDSLNWLERELAHAPDTPTLVALHHPPFSCGLPIMDAIRLLEGAQGFERILRQSHQVAALLCGHIHRSIHTSFGGKSCWVCPSPMSAVVPDFRESSVIRTFPTEASFMLHLLQGETMITHVIMA